MSGMPFYCRRLLLGAALLAYGLVAVEAVKTPAEMLIENGYPSEVYPVQTEDGIYLRLDRIPNPGKPAVLLCNPVLSAGSVYLHMGANYSIGYALHRAGFDVFLGSDRGTAYSRNFSLTYNSSISPESDEYFEFSWHEHAVLDNPAFIKKVLEVSGQSQLSYIGFSMGSNEFLAMVSTLPELNSVIRSAHLMAPVLGWGEASSRMYRLLNPLHNLTQSVVDLLGYHSVPDTLIRTLEQALCPGSSGALCNKAVWYLFDSAREVDYVGNCPDLTSTWPSGGSFGELLHFSQNTRYPRRYKQYDYGVVKNLVKYGKTTPPDYELENIKVPVHAYRGDGDKLVSDVDMEVISRRVPGFVEEWMHPLTGFSHGDFVWDHEAVTLNEKLIQDLQTYW